MNKKIGDLTLREMQQFCRKTIQCEDCPIDVVCDIPLINIIDEDVEKEIKVEEDE